MTPEWIRHRIPTSVELMGHKAIKRCVQHSVRGAAILDTSGGLEANGKGINPHGGSRTGRNMNPISWTKVVVIQAQEKKKEVSGQQICNKSEGRGQGLLVKEDTWCIQGRRNSRSEREELGKWAGAIWGPINCVKEYGCHAKSNGKPLTVLNKEVTSSVSGIRKVTACSSTSL